jgi:hypothetical protein
MAVGPTTTNVAVNAAAARRRRIYITGDLDDQFVNIDPAGSVAVDSTAIFKYTTVMAIATGQRTYHAGSHEPNDNTVRMTMTGVIATIDRRNAARKSRLAAARVANRLASIGTNEA